MRTQVFLSLIAVGALCPSMGLAGQAQQPQTGPTYPVEMVGAFESGCAVCHDNSPTVNMPSRFQIQQMDPEELLAVLNRPIAAHDESARFGTFRTEGQKRAVIEP